MLRLTFISSIFADKYKTVKYQQIDVWQSIDKAWHVHCLRTYNVSFHYVSLTSLETIHCGCILLVTSPPLPDLFHTFREHLAHVCILNMSQNNSFTMCTRAYLYYLCNLNLWYTLRLVNLDVQNLRHTVLTIDACLSRENQASQQKADILPVCKVTPKCWVQMKRR